MIAPEKYIKEAERLTELKSYNILDTLPDQDYDGLTKIAAQICEVPIALISLVDDNRQWFKSSYGLDATETPRDVSFCGHAINDKNNTLIVEDARKDERFFDNPLVIGGPEVIFYTGVPLKSSNGLPLGTLCVIDSKPRVLSDSQNEALKALSKQVINLLALRKKNYKLKDLNTQLEEKNSDLEQFAYAASHDIKSPLSNISNLAGMFLADYKNKIDSNGVDIIELILKSTEQSYKFLDRLMEYSTKLDQLEDVKEDVTITAFKKDILEYYANDPILDLTFTSTLNKLHINTVIIGQILTNLINNAEKYTDKPTVKVNVDISETETHYKFIVSDNGPGIKEEYLEKIFKIFIKLSKTDKYGNEGSGLGLPIVSKLVNKSGGTIKASSTIGEGSSFLFTILK
ncbi:GAF domain-containing protein [Olleya sp. YSTF-M6]|uniref:histidine kinase n=1 Tax=Olleya sediminilitoris TaxID=2795739 RepID=A0ABS1WMK8_9FLAO|nr:ATP-binding protein [Olleya sediminilitoris]MBL7560361.1 GAF domain-containing protein [Olleya sediminilitoris]